MSRPATLDRPEPGTSPTVGKRKWYRRPWIAPLIAVCGLFVLLRLPVYLRFDYHDSILELRSAFPKTHYLLLTGHVAFGSIALLTCCLQVWPWLRRRHPRVHRVSGRIYVLAGVLPGGLLALVASLIAVQKVPGVIGNVALSLLWLGTTFAGFRAARQRRFREHRQWMIRSFALCMSIVANRAWSGIWVAVLLPFKNIRYGGDFDALLSDAVVASIWSSWVVNLIIAEWWMSRRPRRV